MYFKLTDDAEVQRKHGLVHVSLYQNILTNIWTFVIKKSTYFSAISILSDKNISSFLNSQNISSTISLFLLGVNW